jgi:hypothetical protein
MEPEKKKRANPRGVLKEKGEAKRLKIWKSEYSSASFQYSSKYPKWEVEHLQGK